jgi:signal transduction histidine kinase
VTHRRISRYWNAIWKRAGRVALRTKIFGIVITATCLTSIGVVLWTNSRLSQSDSAALASRNPFELGELLSVTFMAMTIGLVIAWFLTSILAHQVLEVTRVAQDVQQGDLSRRAPVWAHDEIGALALAFNAMIDTLAQSRESLQTSNARLEAHNAALMALYDLLAHAAQSMDKDAILEKGLAKLLAVTGAECGGVLLRGEGGAFTEHAAHQLPPCLRDSLSPLTGADPLLRKAIETAEPLRAPVSRADPACQQSALCRAAESGGFGVVYVVPLQTGGAVNGLVLVLQRAAELAAPADKMMLFATMANQLSVAVENATLWEELKHKNAIQTRLLAQAVSAQEQERERISRELHDETGQALTALLVQLKMLDSLPDKDAILAYAGELRQLVLGILEEVRRLARDLRPATLDELGLVPTIDWHIRTFTRNTDLEVDFQPALAESFRLPVSVELALYRVVQEALTNIVRHANATHAVIDLEEQGGVLRLTVSDNGCGFDTNAILNGQHGVGLMGIQERVELIGGTLTLNSVIGRGTRLSVAVPVTDRVILA